MVTNLKQVRNVDSSFCLDTLGKDEKGIIDLGVFFCQGGSSANQVFSWSNIYELRREDLCCSGSSTVGARVRMHHCSGSKSEKWSHTKGGQIVHTESGLCLDVSGVNNGEFPLLNKCDSNKQGQKWEFRTYTSMYSDNSNSR